MLSKINNNLLKNNDKYTAFFYKFIYSYFNFIFYFNSIFFYFLNNSINNNFFNIFLNFNYFNILKLSNYKKNYLFYYINFKKQNSLLKKKNIPTNVLNPVFFRKNLKSKINTNTNKNMFNLLKYTNLNFISKINYKTYFTTLNGKKKLKKTILFNRFYYSLLNNFIFNKSQKLSKSVQIRSKQKIETNLVNFQYSLVNILKSLNIFKSFFDLKKLIKKNYIYLNRNIVTNLNTILNVNDLVEITISYKLFNYCNYIKNIISKDLLKIKNRLWFKLKNSNKKLNLEQNKLIKKSYSYLNKYNYLYNYLEIDFYSFSFFVIYKNLNIYNLNLNIKKILVVYLFKLYNWK